MTDPYRGTGRTTRQINHALSLAKSGKRVAVLFGNQRIAVDAFNNAIAVHPNFTRNPLKLEAGEGSVEFIALWQDPRGRYFDYVMFDHACMDTHLGKHEWAIKQRNAWQAAGKGLANMLPAPRPKALPNLVLRHSDYAAFWVREVVNGFIIETRNSDEERGVRGYEIVAADFADLERKITAVQDVQREAILGFYRPKQEPAAEPQVSHETAMREGA